MSFCSKFQILRSGNSYDTSSKLEKSPHEEEVTGEVEADAVEGNEEKGVIFFPELVDEKRKAVWNIYTPKSLPLLK